jgi:hypothetical protein
MKKFLVGIVLIIAASSVVAQHWHHRTPIYNYYHGHPNDWVAPLIIGGIIGAVITRETIVQQPPVIIQQPLPSNTVIIDGQIYVKQIMQVNGIYREVLVRQ